MPGLCRIMGNNGTVPEHGKCLELCRIMGNARSCAGTWEMPVAVPVHGK